MIISVTEGKHPERISNIKRDTIHRLKEVYGENIPQPILNELDYIIRETYKRAYSHGYEDGCFHTETDYRNRRLSNGTY